MTQVIAEDVFARAGITARCSSAGVAASPGSPASDGARSAAAANGLCLDAHASQPVTKADISAADLVLTMTGSHCDCILGQYPQHNGKIYPIYGYVRGEAFDVQDPFGGGTEGYRLCFDELRGLIEQLADIIIYETGKTNDRNRKRSRRLRIKAGCLKLFSKFKI